MLSRPCPQSGLELDRLSGKNWSSAVKAGYRHCERSEAIHWREMDCFAPLAMTEMLASPMLSYMPDF